MHQPICLITGGTDGVGKATAAALAKRGCTVVIVARNAVKGAAVAQELAAAGDVTHLVADLASLEQTRALAETFARTYPRLDVLINNAGVFLPRRTVTADGFETTFQVNYLAHFLLTQLLLDMLAQSAQGRIVNVSSSVHSLARFDADNLQGERRFSVMGTYAASKLYMLMFTEELARRLVGTRVTANALHPGIVRTPMMLKAPGALRIVSLLSLPFSVSPATGARTPVFLATAPELRDVSGGYFVRAREAKPKSKHDTVENRARLWQLSLDAVSASAARRAG